MGSETCIRDRDYSISAMYIGHRKVTKNFSTKLESSLKIDFQLVLSLVDLDEVIVAASFSERKKRAQASPITIISQDDLRRLPVRSVDEVLSGKSVRFRTVSYTHLTLPTKA